MVTDGLTQITPLITGCHPWPCPMPPRPASGILQMVKVKDESIFSRLHQCNDPSPKRSRKCLRRIAKLTAAVSRVSLKYFLLLRVWLVQTLLRPVMVSPFSCYSVILILILESLRAESAISLSLTECDSC